MPLSPSVTAITFVFRNELRRTRALAIARDGMSTAPSSVNTVFPLLPLRWFVAASGVAAPGGYPR